MIVTWICFHCQKAIAVVKNGRVDPTAGGQMVWIKGAVEEIKLYCCLYCGALQMPPRFGDGAEKSPTPLETSSVDDDAKRYQALKYLLSCNSALVLLRKRGVLGEDELVVKDGSLREVVRGADLDDALNKRRT